MYYKYKKFKFTHKLNIINSTYHIVFILDNPKFNFVGTIYKSNNKLILILEYNISKIYMGLQEYNFIHTIIEYLIENVIEYILNNNLGKFLYIDFEKNNTWKCYFEIIDNEILLQLI